MGLGLNKPKNMDGTDLQLLVSKLMMDIEKNKTGKFPGLSKMEDPYCDILLSGIEPGHYC